jgi:ferrous iron transport protein B
VVDDRLLAKELNVPVVRTAARQGTGLQELIQTIHDVATGKIAGRPHRVQNRSRNLEHAVDILARELEQMFPGLANARWVALRLLDGDERIIGAVRTGELQSITRPTTALSAMPAEANP